MEWLRWIGVGTDGIRSGWRVIIHGFGLILCHIVLIGLLLCGVSVFGLLLGATANPNSEVSLYSRGPTLILLGMLVTYLGVVLLVGGWHWASGWLLDRGGPISAGLGGPWSRSTLEFLQGTVIGALLILPPVILMGITGEWSLQMSEWSATGVAMWIGWSVTLIFAASWEELIFRGYGFTWLCRSLTNGARFGAGRIGLQGPWLQPVTRHGGRALPILAASLLFGLVHMANPGHTWIATLNTAIAGIWLSIALFRSGSLWLPIGLHWGWNWCQGLLLGMPVSGLGSDESGLYVPSPLHLEVSGAEWLSGGTYGVEGSIFATGALLLGTAIAAVGPKRAPHHRHAAMVFPEDLEAATDQDLFPMTPQEGV